MSLLSVKEDDSTADLFFSVFVQEMETGIASVRTHTQLIMNGFMQINIDNRKGADGVGW